MKNLSNYGWLPQQLASRLASVLAGLALLATTGVARAQTLPLAPASARAAVPEASGYGILYQLDIPNAANFNSSGVPYGINNSAVVMTNPARVAYYLELTNGTTTTYVWTSMANFATTLTQLGIPNPGTNNVNWHQNVSSLNVFSNVVGMSTGTNLGTGRIEMWPTNYAPNNSDLVPGASDGTFDFGDQQTSNGSYGSFQVHNVTAIQTVLAYNNWGGNGGNGDIGIGNQPQVGSSNPDWTFAGNAGNYSVKRITILATSVPALTSLSPTNGPVGNSITLTGTNLGGTTGVSFNGTAATFAVVNATTVTATVPTGATTGNVTVTTPGGTSNGLAFTVAPTTNNALAFDGVNDYVHSTSTLPATGEFTLEGWVNPTAYGGSFNAFVLSDNFPAGAMHAQFEGGNGYGMEFTINGNIPSDVHTLLKPVLGQWSHIAVVYSASAKTVKFYLNGTLFTSASYTTAVSVAALSYSLGGWLNGTTPDRLFNGKFDEMRIYNAALTLAQVQADMFSTASALPTSLKAYYNFDQGTAGGNNAGITTLNDQSGNGNTGTLTNFALTGTTSNFVRSFPTITGISPTSGPRGSSVTVAGTNLADATAFAFNGTAVTPFTTPSNDFSTTVTVPAAATTGPVSLASAALTTFTGSVFTVVSDLVVSTGTPLSPTLIPGGNYNSIIVTGTGNGTLAGNVTVASAVTVQNGGTLNDGCFVLSGAGSFTLAAGGTLGICSALGITPSGATGTMQLSGTRSFSTDASYVYNGTAAQATGTGLPAMVRNLTVANPADVALTQSTSVAQVLTLSNTGNLTLGSQSLTLLSSAAGTALAVNSGTGIVSGTTGTVQRYLDPSVNAGLGYRHYSAPVSGATVASLATAGFAPVLTAAYNTSATPGTTTPFPNVFTYDQARLVSATNNLSAFDKGYVVPLSSSPLAVGQGYAVNLSASPLVAFVGTLTTGPQVVNLARNSGATAPDAGWALVGNPYPAPLDFALIPASDRPNLDAAMYVFESNATYTGSYRTFVNGVGISSLIGSGQGFFVRVSTGQIAGTLVFRNAHRLTSYATQVPVRRGTADTRPLVQLELRGTTGPADALFAYAETGATPAFDAAFDAVKRTNSTGLNLASLATSGEALAIDGRPAFTPATVLPLTVGVPAAGSYSLTAAALSNLPAGLDALLTDNATGQTVNLSQQPAYTFTVSATQAATLITRRFALSFAARSVLATTTALTAAEITLYPNPTHAAFTVLVPAVAGASRVQGTLFNALGQVVRQQTAALPAAGARFTVETADLAAGVYTLRLQVGATTLAKRVVIQ